MKKERANRWIAIAIIGLVYLFLVCFPFSRWIASKWWNYGISLAIRVAFLVFAVIYARANKLFNPGFKRLRWKDFRFLPFLLIVISNLFVGLFSAKSDSPLADVWLQIPVCLLTACAEEYIFRVLIAKEAASQTREPWKGILWSAFFFGLIHLTNISSVDTIVPALIQVVYCFFLGLLLGYMYLETENAILPVALHFAFNFLNGVLIPTIYDLRGDWVYFLVNGLVGLVVIGYGLLLFFVGLRHKPAENEDQGDPASA